MQSRRIPYAEFYDYGRLEKAAQSLHREETEENEVELLNLHNHLVWHSYHPGENPETDAILSVVIKELLIENNLDDSAIPTELRSLASAL